MDFSVSKWYDLNLSKFPVGIEAKLVSPWKNSLLEQIEEDAPGLIAAAGAYVFCVRHGSNVKPWYVGKTWAKTGFKGEIFQKHKLEHLKALKAKRGTKGVVFFPLLTKSKKGFSSNSSSAKGLIEWVEGQMISMAQLTNPDLLNSKRTNFVKNVRMPGLFGKQNKGPVKEDATLARSIFRKDGK